MRKWMITLWLSLSTGLVAADVLVTDATIREMLPGRTMTAGYFSIRNKTAVDTELMAVSSPLFAEIELHQHSYKDGMMRMEQVHSVVVAAGEQIHFQPGGLHLMLFDAKTSLIQGQQVLLDFTFKDGKSLKVSAIVSAIPTH